jgi:RAD51-like protein 2
MYNNQGNPNYLYIREISTFPLSLQQKNKLLKKGFKNINDLQNLTPTELAKEIEVSKEEALEILKIIKKEENNYIINEGVSAFDLLKKDLLNNNKINFITTFNSSMDEMLGGGIPLGKITEFSGVPGIGKTQLGIQLSINVNIPSILDGVEGECIYIDTEGSFVIERVIEMSNSLINYIKQILLNNEEKRINEEDKTKIIENFNLEYILSRIHYFRIHDYVEQIGLINILPNIIEKKFNIKLIIIDSVAFHFRHDFEDMRIRSKLLNNLSQSLLNIANKYNIAIVLMNQMTTKINKINNNNQNNQNNNNNNNNTNNNETILIPALGENWGYLCNNRIILYWNDGKRYANLFKSSIKKENTISFIITKDGIR